MTEYVLKTPIKVIDQTIDRILFRPVTGRDLVGLPDAETDKWGWSIALADRMARNVPPGTVFDLPAVDALGCANAVAAAMNPTTPGPSTATSSVPGGGTTQASST